MKIYFYSCSPNLIPEAFYIILFYMQSLVSLELAEPFAGVFVVEYARSFVVKELSLLTWSFC
jgi:hypothetical protein